jgi:hypothetical protein
MKGVAFALVGFSLSCAVACGTEDSTFPGDKPADGAGTGTGTGTGTGSQGGFETKDVPTAPDGCAASAKLVYVMSQEKDLYSFTPNTTTFTKVGRVSCPAVGIPTSMAIDRSGTAWVNYADGSLYKVSTSDASCAETGFVKGQQGFLKFGMAFATNSATSTDETLYISGLLGTEGKGFGKIDLGTLKVTMLGEYSNNLAGEVAELTGTGDGHLFGFFTTSPAATLAEIAHSSGATSSDKPLLGVNTGNAFAFSFWGGDFWFYTSDGTSASKVTQLKASGNGELVVAKTDVGGFRIVGAGVSTCAPVTAPR